MFNWIVRRQQHGHHATGVVTAWGRTGRRVLLTIRRPASSQCAFYHHEQGLAHGLCQGIGTLVKESARKTARPNSAPGRAEIMGVVPAAGVVPGGGELGVTYWHRTHQ